MHSVTPKPGITNPKYDPSMHVLSGPDPAPGLPQNDARTLSPAPAEQSDDRIKLFIVHVRTFSESEIILLPAWTLEEAQLQAQEYQNENHNEDSEACDHQDCQDCSEYPTPLRWSHDPHLSSYDLVSVGYSYGIQTYQLEKPPTLRETGFA